MENELSGAKNGLHLDELPVQKVKYKWQLLFRQETLTPKYNDAIWPLFLMVLSTMHTVSGSKVEIFSTIEAQQPLGWADIINNMLVYVSVLS